VADEPEKHEMDYDESTELIYNIIKDQFLLFIEKKNTLDKKASQIIIFSGIVISLYAGVGSFLLKDMPKDSAFNLDISYYTILLSIFFIGTVLLISSIICALRAYDLRAWSLAPDPQRLIDEYGKTHSSKSKILKVVSGTIADTIEDNKDKVDDKVKFVKRAFRFLLLGLITYIVFMLLFLIVNQR